MLPVVGINDSKIDASGDEGVHDSRIGSHKKIYVVSEQNLCGTRKFGRELVYDRGGDTGCWTQSHRVTVISKVTTSEPYRIIAPAK